MKIAAQYDHSIPIRKSWTRVYNKQGIGHRPGVMAMCNDNAINTFQSNAM